MVKPPRSFKAELRASANRWAWEQATLAVAKACHEDARLKPSKAWVQREYERLRAVRYEHLGLTLPGI